MIHREGTQTLWRTTITTVDALHQRIAAKQDLPS
jgi:hypothetical protein